MTLDPDQRIAIIGTPGNGDVVPVEQTAGGGLRLRLGGGRTFAFSIPVVGACGASMIYDDLRFVIDASGTAVGDGSRALGDVRSRRRHERPRHDGPGRASRMPIPRP